jgi:hypothetical protein
MTAELPFAGICTVYDCLPQYLQAGCFIGFVICVVIVIANRNRWFR